MPANWCPFCPDRAMSRPTTTSFYIRTISPPSRLAPIRLRLINVGDSEDLFDTTGAHGACDVVLYSPNHTLPPSDLTVESWRKVVGLWTEAQP